MSSVSGTRTSSHGDIQANGTQLTGPSTSATGFRNVIQSFAIVLRAASLAACAQSSVVTKNSGFVAASRQAALEHNRRASFVTNRRVAVTKKHTPFASNKNAAETPVASHGLASFYTEGRQTASGEKFDTHELTAAHPTLPFGTRLRVTNVATGRSVTVRVNDRGPFVHGRVIDVSYSAAERLRMVRKWIADLTYVLTAEGCSMWPSVVDLYSRRGVGWSMNAAMTTQLVTDALVMAIWRRANRRGCIIPSAAANTPASSSTIADHGVV